MIKHWFFIISGLVLVVLLFLAFQKSIMVSENGAPPYAIEDLNPPDTLPFPLPTVWKRPDGPARVGLQVGHWKNNELPDELERLRGNTGASGGGHAEWQVNLTIAELTKKKLEERSVAVDILPATVPQDYYADVFLAIHADGSTNLSASGFKIASPRRDFTGDSESLISFISSSYARATKLDIDPQISRNMTGYYAFAWWRYDHAIHPRTTAAILETGFLSNASDRSIIVDRPELSAQGISEGILAYLTHKKLVK